MKRYISSSDEIIDTKTLLEKVSDIAKKNNCLVIDDIDSKTGSTAKIYPSTKLTNNIIQNVFVWISNQGRIITSINYIDSHSITEETNVSNDLNSSIDTLKTIYSMISEIQKINVIGG